MNEDNKWKNKSFFKAAKYSLEGIIYFIKNGRNIKIQIVAALLVIIAAIILKVNAIEMAILVLTIFLVFAFEVINTSIENLADLYTMEYNEKVKVIKDTAAGAVSLVALGAVVVGIMIFLPKILHILNWL